MKILITSHRFHPDIGGIETITDILARYFIDSHHAVCVVTQSVAEASSDRLLPFSVLRRPSILELLHAYRWADVVLQNNLELRTLWPLLLCWRPVVIGLQTWVRTVNGKRNLLQRCKLLALHLADVLIACSDAVRLDSNPRAIVIGNPYNSALFHSFSATPRLQSIAFLGRLVSDKGADLLLQAFAALKPAGWRLSVIGTGPEHPVLEHLAADLGVSDAVDFLGALQGEQLVAVLNQHEILVVPSRWREPFGVVALEGMACGCVLLASDGGGLPDAVGSGGLLFRRGDLADLTTKLDRLIRSPQLRQRLRTEAPLHLQAFQSEVVCDRYLSVLQHAVARAA